MAKSEIKVIEGDIQTAATDISALTQNKKKLSTVTASQLTELDSAIKNLKSRFDTMKAAHKTIVQESSESSSSNLSDIVRNMTTERKNRFKG